MHGKVRLLVPMVAQLREVRLLFEAIERAKAQLRARAQPFLDVAIGAMIEVPAAALMLPSLLKHFDFVSIGTNDLIQYTLAIDRADEAKGRLPEPGDADTGNPEQHYLPPQLGRIKRRIEDVRGRDGPRL